MATETAERRASYRRSLQVPATATLAGVLAGVVSASVASSATDSTALAAAFGAILLGMGVMRLLGVDVGEFSTKDNLYVAFMTVSMWFITWTILLTTNASPI